jgi:hypothetical protein
MYISKNRIKEEAKELSELLKYLAIACVKWDKN